MNKKTNTILRKTNFLLILCLLLAFSVNQSPAQTGLRDVVKDADLEWMIGSWSAATDQGDAIHVSYEWKLEGHLVAAGIKIGKYAYRSMIYYVPDRQTVVEVGVDSRGGTVTGTWDVIEDKAVSKTDRTDAEGRTTKVAISHAKIDANTMLVELFAVEDGNLADQPWATMEFERLPSQNTKESGKIIKQGRHELGFEEDVIKTARGNLKMTFIGHGTLMFTYNEKVIHVDPWTRLADYSRLPKADLILVTHEHGDHLDPQAIAALRKNDTRIVLTEACLSKVPGGIVMKNGDRRTVRELTIEAVPAYNIVHKRSGGAPYHPPGSGNGYIVNFGDTRVYIAGDTENIPEMKKLKNIDIAFLPMNLPYTMTPEMVADAARSFKPKVVYPYHYGQTDPNKLVDLLKKSGDIEVRVRSLK